MGQINNTMPYDAGMWRKGNLFTHGRKVYRVHEILHDHVMAYFVQEDYDEDVVMECEMITEPQPILLTPKIVPYLGMNYNDSVQGKDYFEMQIESQQALVPIITITGGWVVNKFTVFVNHNPKYELKYAHEIQNLYHAILRIEMPTQLMHV